MTLGASPPPDDATEPLSGVLSSLGVNPLRPPAALLIAQPYVEYAYEFQPHLLSRLNQKRLECPHP
jgi:hypothetical protein